MTAPKKPRGAGATSTAGGPKPVPQPAFELTAEEMAWAVRFFSGCRRMADDHRRACMSFADVAESLAADYPARPPAALRLVRGGVQ